MLSEATRVARILQCQGCGEPFNPKNGKLTQRYCSKRCGAQHRPKRGIPTSTSFKPGQTPWNKGKQNWREGYQHSEETKDAIRRANSGENAPNWKGGISSENERFRKTAAYREWRKAVFTRDDYTCQECGDRSRAGHRIRIHADHIKPFALYPDLRLDLNNGRTLCETCHRQTPTYGNGSRTGETAVLVTDNPMQSDKPHAIKDV